MELQLDSVYRDPVKSEFLGPSSIHGRYAKCIGDAKKHLVVVMPWFTPSPQLKDALYGMLERDVKLTLVTRPPEEARNREHEAQLAELLKRQRRVTKKKLFGMLGGEVFDSIELLLVENVHAKTIIQDDACVVVTSSNLNVMSIARNTEFGIVTGDRSVVKDAKEAIQNLRGSDRTRSVARGNLKACDCGVWLLRERDASKHTCSTGGAMASVTPVAAAPAQPVARHQPAPVATPAPETPPAPSPVAKPVPIAATAAAATASQASVEKLSTSKFARVHKLKTGAMLRRLVECGYLEPDGDRHVLTTKGTVAGGELLNSKRFGPYFVWPASLQP